MKNKIVAFLFFVSIFGFGQSKHSYVEANYFYGNLLRTNADATIFLQGHPTGFYASYNIKTTGKEEWQRVYNYPDVGISFGYQDYKSDVLGELFALYGHFNFYLNKRTSPNQLILRTGIGLAYNTNPYDKVTNNKNTAFGSSINSSTYFKLYYQRENLIKNLGVTAGLTFIHASNSNVKSPNSGANVWALTVGLNYNLSSKNDTLVFKEVNDIKKITEPIKLNLAIRGGVNESPYIGSGQKPFFVGSVYLDKRISRKSAFQLGTDIYISPMLKDYYEIESSKPNSNITEPNSFMRLGAFVGYELFINKLSIVGQLGYYLVYPIEFDGRVYETLGLKRYFKDDKKWFASVRLKAHAANAETVEFGVGIRL